MSKRMSVMSEQESHMKVEGLYTYENFFEEEEYSVIHDKTDEIDVLDNLLSDIEDGCSP